MKSSDEKIGYIKIIETPTFISKHNKYLVEVRAYEPIGQLEYDTFEIFSCFADILKKRKIKRPRGRIGKVIERFDKEEGHTFYHYLFYIACNEKYDSEDVADCLKSHLARDEGCKIQSVYAEQIKLFPWEKSKVKIRIPITQKMIEDIVKRKKKNDKADEK